MSVEIIIVVIAALLIFWVLFRTVKVQRFAAECDYECPCDRKGNYKCYCKYECGKPNPWAPLLGNAAGPLQPRQDDQNTGCKCECPCDIPGDYKCHCPCPCGNANVAQPNNGNNGRPTSAANTARMYPGQVLDRGTQMVSPSGKLALRFQQRSGRIFVCHVRTSNIIADPGNSLNSNPASINYWVGAANRLTLKQNGSLVLVMENGTEYKLSEPDYETSQTGFLTMQDDGNVVLYAKEAGRVMFASNTNWCSPGNDYGSDVCPRYHSALPWPS